MKRRRKSAPSAAARCIGRWMSPTSKASKEFASAVARDFGPIDILFNNAGMNIRKPFEAYTEDEFDRIISVH
jgi:NAD(P)-dependent dehydrogenase (short-subunit alcohol dehydrogenase family)